MFSTNFARTNSILAICVLTVSCAPPADAPPGSADLRRAGDGTRELPWRRSAADAGTVADSGPTSWPADSAASAPADSGPVVLLADSGPTIRSPEEDAGASAPADSGPVVLLADSGPTIRSPEADAGASAPADSGPIVMLADAAPTVFGVTIDDPWAAAGPGSALLDALDGLVGAGGRRPTARVVFDSGVDRVFREGGITAADYLGPVAAIGAHARVMGELLDSFYVPTYDAAQLRARACEYRATLGHLVDIWEIGNEVNGEWLLAPGEAATVVVDEIVAVVEVFQAGAAGFAALCPDFTLRADERPFELALTAYGNGPASSAGCWASPAHHMETWLAEHFGPGGRGAAVRDALDLVLVSYYEDDCEGLQPDWQGVFDRVGAIFPAARLGIGECGTVRVADAARYVERYYGGASSVDPALANMHVTHPRFVGGMFWWYFSRDFETPAIYDVLRRALDAPFWAR